MKQLQWMIIMITKAIKSISKTLTYFIISCMVLMGLVYIDNTLTFGIFI